ncbi:MAG: hypothetical protein ACYDBJ_15735 [Aggregatilineales bacterium]
MRRFLMPGALLVAFLALVASLLLRSAFSAAAPVTLTPSATDTLVLTASATATETFTPTVTSSPSPTATITPSATFTPSITPSPTPTLAVQRLVFVAVNPGVTLDAPTATPLTCPCGTTLTSVLLPTFVVPSPEATLAYVPTGDAPPVVGWRRYAVDNPTLQQVGNWAFFTSTFRSANHRYLYTDTSGAKLTLRFLGAAVRVRYAQLSSYGVFEVRLDGQTVTTVDAYLSKAVMPNGDFVTTPVYDVPYGWHTLEILRLDQRDPASSGGFVAIDGIDVYQDGPLPTLLSTGTALPTSSATPTPAPAIAIQLVVAPPTVQPTITPISPGVIDLSVVIGYDADGNKVIEPSEGVAGVSVRVVRADTNHVVASGVTDSAGYVHLQVEQTSGLLVIVPYLGKSWMLPAPSASNAGASYAVSYTLLVPPVNAPALIP